MQAACAGQQKAAATGWASPGVLPSCIAAAVCCNSSSGHREISDRVECKPAGSGSMHTLLLRVVGATALDLHAAAAREREW
jgi:hypothetical protein